jgi:hypothetical protein
MNEGAPPCKFMAQVDESIPVAPADPGTTASHRTGNRPLKP